MSAKAQDQRDHVVRCATVRDVIVWFGHLNGPYSLTVCVETDSVAVLRLVVMTASETVTVVTDASWLATLWRMGPGDRRAIRIAELTVPLEACSRAGRSAASAVHEVQPT